jgi:hypothetical protein
MANDNSVRLGKKELLSLKSKGRSEDYNQAIDDAIDLIGKMEQDIADKKAKAAAAAAARKAAAIAGRGSDAPDIYDDLLDIEERNGSGQPLQFDVVFGCNIEDVGTSRYYEKDSVDLIPTIEKAMDAFYDFVAKYGKQAVNGMRVVLEDCNEYDEITIVAEYSDGKLKTECGTFYC